MPAQAGHLRFNQYTFNPATLELRREGELVHLPPKPSQALGLLIEQAGSLVTREELHRRVWPDTIVELDQGLNTCIKHLRATLGDPADTPIFIETVPRRGYRFIAQVVSDVDVASLARRRGRTWRPPLAAGFAAIVLGVALWGMWGSAAPPAPMRLAVLPFQILGTAETDRLFGDGLSEELITTLAGLDPDRLEVVGRASAARFRDDYSLAEVGEALKVDYIVEGSVRPDEAGYRVSARLVRVADQIAVWSDQFDRTADQPVSTQEWLASRVSSAVVPSLLSPEGTLRSRRDPLPQVRVSWLMARHLLNRLDSAAAARSLPLLYDVLEHDPSFALAHVSLARALLRTNRTNETEDALDQAFQLDPEVPEYYLTRGRLRLTQWRLDEAGGDLEAAATGSGNARSHHMFAYYLALVGRHVQARREMFRAVELDPISQAVLGDVGLFDYWARRPREAIAACERALQVALPEYRIRANRCLFNASLAAGMYERARDYALAIIESAPVAAEARRSISEPSDPKVAVQRYLRWGAEPENMEFSQGSTSAYARARALAAVGDVDGASRALEQALEERDPSLIQIGVEPRLDPLRDDHRFQAVARAVGVDASH